MERDEYRDRKGRGGVKERKKDRYEEEEKKSWNREVCGRLTGKEKMEIE